MQHHANVIVRAEEEIFLATSELHDYLSRLADSMLSRFLGSVRCRSDHRRCVQGAFTTCCGAKREKDYYQAQSVIRHCASSPCPADEVGDIVYDRGNPKQMITPHQAVDAKTYMGEKVKLPSPEEIPGCQLEVQNYHCPPVGTFHSKYMVVDRKVAILNSNNIQDRVSSHLPVERMLISPRSTSR